jgi:hypothetical protein
MRLPSSSAARRGGGRKLTLQVSSRTVARPHRAFRTAELLLRLCKGAVGGNDFSLSVF